LLRSKRRSAKIATILPSCDDLGRVLVYIADQDIRDHFAATAPQTYGVVVH
jgi:hypothetical protein